MSIEKMRESFVVFAADEGFCFDQLENNNFKDPDTAMAFEIWVQSRAAIEVELPKVAEYFDQSEYPHTCEMLERDLRSRIESLGLKVKP